MTKIIIAALFIIGILIIIFNGRKAAPFPSPTPSVIVKEELPTTIPTTIQTNMQKQYTKYPEMIIDPNKNYEVTLETSKGILKLKLFPKEAPKTVNNFVFLTKEGFYNETKFHRIIKGFMIQGGDPKGNGTGGPGYQFADESVTRDYKRGTIAMANSGSNTNGSQFFIMHQDYDLPKNYTIFGEVIEGIEVVDKIAEVQVAQGTAGENSTPLEEIKIINALVSEN